MVLVFKCGPVLKKVKPKLASATKRESHLDIHKYNAELVWFKHSSF